MKHLLLIFSIATATTMFASEQDACPIDMAEMLDESTLDIEVIQDWHRVDRVVPTRQKYMTINVGEVWPGQQYRVPVRLIVPADRKAKGFHLTGGHQLKGIQKDATIEGVSAELIRGGVGLVYTIIQNPGTWGQKELGDEMRKRFIETLNTRYSIQFWGWPAGLCRAVTAAYSETDYIEKGKVVMSGGSKNGASPSVSLIHDDRLTAIHASVSPIWDSPLRMGDKKAWEALNIEDKEYAHRKGLDTKLSDRITRHAFRGGLFGPDYNPDALREGHSWERLVELAKDMADHIFISRNLNALNKRGVDFFFAPGTHDFVCFDVAWGGIHHQDIPIYLAANTGHGKRKPHPASEKGVSNLPAFLLSHFFDEVDEFLEPPTISADIDGNQLSLSVQFPEGSKAESGRIWWMFDRGSDGSGAYLAELIPDDNWEDMEESSDSKSWTVQIDLDDDASRIDVFSNHRKTIRYKGRNYPTYISSPYTRVDLD